VGTHTSAGIEYGPSSAGVLRMDKRFYQQSLPTLTRPYMQPTALPATIFVLFSLREQSTRGMIANFPMLLLRTCNYLERYAEELIRI